MTAQQFAWRFDYPGDGGQTIQSGELVLPIDRAAMGNRFEVETPTGRHWATTVPKPFIDPEKDIPKR